jgi:capsular exopolysaccharide synthesis family protein
VNTRPPEDSARPEPQPRPADTVRALRGGGYDASTRYTPPGLGDISLERLVRIARRKRFTLAATFVFALLAGAFYLATAPKIYRAETLVEMSVMRPRIMGQRSAVIDDTEVSRSEEIFNTRIEKFKSPGMTDRVITNLTAAGVRLPAEGQALRQLIERSVTMLLVRRSRLLRISFTHTDRGFAVAVADAYANAAEAMGTEENKAASDSAVAWLLAQAGNQREALEKADQALLDFSRENSVGKIELEKKRVEQSLDGFNAALTDVQSRLALAREVHATMTRISLSPQDSGNLPDSIPHAKEIQTTLDQWIEALAKRDLLQTKYTAEHPEVQAQEQLIKALWDKVRVGVLLATETARSNLELLDKQERSLRDTIEQQSRSAAALEQQILECTARRTALERTRDAADMSYKGILNRIEEARLSADENTATLKIVERARLPERPVKPNKKVIAFLALCLGVFGGLGLALVTDALEDSVSNADDLERDLGLRIVGITPVVPNSDLANPYLAGLTDPFTPIAEAFAGVRTLLDSAQYEGAAHSVLITSVAPEEGKTLSACNLAIASAKSGRRTLLVDMDLRRPRVARAFKLPTPAHELGQALRNPVPEEFARLPVKTECPGLEIIAGAGDPNLRPVDVFGMRSIQAFLSWAEEAYDRVIVDSPPIGPVGDATAVAGVVGSVILVCRAHKTRKRSLGHAVRHFRDVGANVIGVMVNGVDARAGGFFNSFGYYGTYGTYRSVGDHNRRRT